MKDYCMECLQVNNAITRLVDKFWKKYYGEDFKIERIDRKDEDLHCNLRINTIHRNIDEIYTALWFDIPKEIVLKFKEEQTDKAIKKETFMNLKNFYFLNKKWESSSK